MRRDGKRWSRRVASMVVAAVLLLPLIAAGQGRRWWTDPDARHELRLTSAQVEQLDRLFSSRLTERRQRQRRIEELQVRFDEALARGDEAAALAAIEPLEDLRFEQRRARARLLVRMMGILTPSQRETLQHRRAAR